TLGVSDLVSEPVGSVGRVGGLSVWARMELGREAHVTHQRARAGESGRYAREVTVRHATEVDGFAVTVQGRIDGVLVGADGDPVVVEEIKSVVQRPESLPGLGLETYPHYVEQLRLYCFLVSRSAGVSLPAAGGVRGRLVLVNLVDGARRELEVVGPFDDVAGLIANRVRLLIRQAEFERKRQRERETTAAGLAFPYPQMRPHQDQMVAAVARAVEAGRHVMVLAPSGVGKTAGALYPALRWAMKAGGRVFFVTAKNTQHEQALETVRRMPGVRAVSWRARETMCINTVYACREEFCPYLQMMAAKLERTGVVRQLEAGGVVATEDLVAAGRVAGVCPFDLGMVLAEQADCVVCDYNYVFDPQVYLRQFFLDADYSDSVLIVDEAHNLVERARAYYSPRLTRAQLREAVSALGSVERSLAREIRRLVEEVHEFFERLERDGGDEYSQVPEKWEDDFGEEETLWSDLERRWRDAMSRRAAGGARWAQRYRLVESPRGFFEGLRPVVNRLAVRYALEKIARGQAVEDDPVEAFFGTLTQMAAVLAWEGEEFAYVYEAGRDGGLHVVCMDASRMLAERMAGFRSVVAMSTTLEPVEFYRQMLGLEESRTDVVRLASPFPSERRRILVVGSVWTTYARRPGSHERIAEIIRTVTEARAGNYLALFPSYEFLNGVAPFLPGALCQRGDMSAEEREQLVAALRRTDEPKLVLAVQGGALAEGVDYAGEVLAGVIVVSPALPQVGWERELMRGYFERRYGRGFEYAYLYPGMARVVQSVGRLIRSERDRGVAVLICGRFLQRQYSTLMPADWSKNGEVLISKDLRKELAEFWALQGGSETYNPANSQEADGTHDATNQG
ncbi:MAG: hypothetical protein N3A53_03720, partial [Verrucomicrobiae bacterium]|nr:hypothetical protein [Verrucomicrobiae bacterium]